jgi:diphthamide synthase (EF-2-diphthine--ammonia ligase)
MNILFWSGGKDAFLALHVYRQAHPEASIRLLTTFDQSTQIVPHQNIPIEEIKEQARMLGLELIDVPLPSDCPNDKYLKNIEQALQKLDYKINQLIFGDWHLSDIREWREQQFSQMGFDCHFPIWETELDQLLPILTLQPVEVTISAVRDDLQHLIRVGETYDQSFVMQLKYQPDDIDPMGENGEFHTKLTFKKIDEQKIF